MNLFRRLWYLLHRARAERELREEIELHRQMRESRLEAGSQSADMAHRSSLQALGNVRSAREDSRDVWVPVLLQQVLQDLRYTLRSVRRSPGFNVATTSMLAVGIGFVAGGYIVFNGLFLREWDLPEVARVFTVLATRPDPGGSGDIRDGLSLGAFRHLTSTATRADYVASVGTAWSLRPDGASRARMVTGTFASNTFIEVLRIPLQMGTGHLRPTPGQPPAIVVSDAVWRRDFNADPGIVGKTAWLNGAAVVVTGVMSHEFTGLGAMTLGVIVGVGSVPRVPDTWLADVVSDDTLCCMSVAGRLHVGETRQSAETEIKILTDRYRSSIGRPTLAITVAGTTLAEGGQALRSNTFRSAVAMIGFGLALVLLLTCANVGNLYLARGLRRTREITMRFALGANRARIVRQLITEGLVTAGTSGLGVLAVAISVPRVLHWVEDDVSGNILAADWRVMAFTTATGVLTAFLVALGPALHVTRAASPRGPTGMSAPTGRFRSALLATQIAIALVLVLGATLVARGINRASTMQADFALDQTTLVEVSRPSTGVAGRTDPAPIDRDALLRGGASHGLRLGVINAFVSWSGFNTVVTTIRHGTGPEFRTHVFPVSANAASILDLRLREGRWPDADPSRAEAVVNDRLASRLWPNGHALGSTFRLARPNRTYQVVGVANDSRVTDLHGPPQPIVHIAPADDFAAPAFLARTDPRLEATVRSVFESVVPGADVRVRPLREVMAGQRSDGAAVGSAIAGSLGLVALIVAGLGLFSVFSYLVEARRREIGIRLALGASPRQIVRSLIRATTAPAVAGIGVGMLASALVALSLRRFLFGLSPADPVSFAIVAAIFGLAAVVSTAVPLRRALGTDPAVTLRSE